MMFYDTVITCPYCKHEESNYDETDYYDIRIDNFKCSKCGKEYTLQSEVEVKFRSSEHGECFKCGKGGCVSHCGKCHEFICYDCGVYYLTFILYCPECKEEFEKEKEERIAERKERLNE